MGVQMAKEALLKDKGKAPVLVVERQKDDELIGRNASLRTSMTGKK